MSGADGGIIITASHNPRQWNALKLLNSEGEFLTAADGAEVLRIAEAEAYLDDMTRKGFDARAGWLYMAQALYAAGDISGANRAILHVEALSMGR